MKSFLRNILHRNAPVEPDNPDSQPPPVDTKEPRAEEWVKRYEFLNSETGEFDYEGYRRAQIAGHDKKLDDIWADEKTLDLIADHVRKRGIEVRFGICHGCKKGFEQGYLSKQLNAPFIGTDISDNADTYPDTVEWDFHERKPEWSGSAQVIYTNSLDHAYDPGKAMRTWIDQLADGGLIFIEHTRYHTAEYVSPVDPFGAHAMVMPYLIAEWGKGEFFVTEVLHPAHKKPYWKPSEKGMPPSRTPTDLEIWLFVVERRRA